MTPLTPREYGDDLHAQHCPVTRSKGEMIVAGHAEVVEVALDPETFSNAVSRHLQLPNGLDGVKHAEFRKLLDLYLADEIVSHYFQVFQGTAREVLTDAGLVADLSRLAATYSVRAMLRWLSWPAQLENRLLDWVAESSQAARSRDNEWNARVAADFDEIITQAVAQVPEDSVTARLVADHDLVHEEVVSVLRNWTAGDLGSMAKCIGVILATLAQSPEVQDRLRSGVDRTEFIAIADEILRIDDPFVSNRRVATCPARVGEQSVDKGEVVRLHWTAANRDPKVFAGWDPQGHAEQNLVWGIGAHYCPGKPLAMYELEAFFSVLLQEFDVVSAPVGERDVAGGWTTPPVQLQPR